MDLVSYLIMSNSVTGLNKIFVFTSALLSSAMFGLYLDTFRWAPASECSNVK